MPLGVPLVGGSYRGSASKTPRTPPHPNPPPRPTPPLIPPLIPPRPPPPAPPALPFLPLSSFPVLGPARLPRRRAQAFTITPPSYVKCDWC